MKIVLAYSGGLDTSVILTWLKQNYDAEIIAFCAKDGALGVLSHLLQVSYEGGLFGPPLTRTLLRLDPDWDNLRGDPRFEKLCQEK